MDQEDEVTQEEIITMRAIPTYVSGYINNWEKVLAIKIVEYRCGRLCWHAGADRTYWLFEQ